MLINRLVASTSFRLSATYAALLVLSFLFAAGGAWLTTRASAVNEACARLEEAHRDLVSELETRGATYAPQAIEERMRRHDDLLWRLSTPQGHTIAGDGDIPNHVIGVQVFDLPTSGHSAGDYAVATWDFPSGARLSIADNIERSERIRNAVLTSLLWVGAVAALLAIAAGVWVTRRTLARMDGLGGAARAFGAGDLSARAPIRNARSPDDLDDLVARFNDMLEQVNVLIADVQRVSADVAHDLRTPLSHLRQRLELARQAGDVEGCQSAIAAAQDSIDEILRTFDAMLQLSAIQAGTDRTRFEPIDLSAILERVADAYRPDVEASGRSLEIANNAAAPIIGNKALISQAIANLLANAIRHTQNGARIRALIQIGQAHISLIVQDDGPGIPEEARDAVLQPFKRLDASRSAPGSGLGLSIVAAIARAHGARLALYNSNPGLSVKLTFDRA